MALQSSFFNRRESDATRPSPVVPIGDTAAPAAAPPTPVTPTAVTPTMPSGAASGKPVLHGALLSRESGPSRIQIGSASADNPGKLNVGQDIKLKGGEINDCDTLMVEGLVEAVMQARLIQIEKTGEFDGSARVETAVIRGVFRGTLDVRKQLVVRAGGRVIGTVRYGSLVVEEGGHLIGDVQFSPPDTP